MTTTQVVSANRLPPLDLAILKLVWKDLFSGSGGGLSRRQLEDELPNVLGEQVKTPTLKAHLRKLVTRGMLEPDESNATKAGGVAYLYKMNDETMITWTSTAVLLLRLWAHPGKNPDKATLVKSLMDEAVRNSATQMPATEKEWEEALTAAKKRGYISHEIETVVRGNAKIAFEYDYLKFVAEHHR